MASLPPRKYPLLLPVFGNANRICRLWHRTVGAFLVRRKLYGLCRRVNLCSGHIVFPDYWNIDLHPAADILLDLNREPLPFPNACMDGVVCMSAINYFSRRRGAFLIGETCRILAPGGIARFGTQDLEKIAKRYVDKDRAFFFQKLDGRERFHGVTMGDKFNSWFYGYETTGGNRGKYFYDFETLSLLFQEAGFAVIENRSFQDSRIPGFAALDNRPEQMFFLEAVKAPV
jgi:SAM-dependent methyltransferase